MSPNQARKHLKDFLIARTSIHKDIFHGVVINKFNEICKHTAKNKNATQDELDVYIEQHYDELNKETHRIIENICAEALPHNQYKYLLGHIGVLSIFLLPPLYPLISYAIDLWRAPVFNQVAFVGCIVSIFLLLMVMGASSYATFLASMTKK